MSKGVKRIIGIVAGILLILGVFLVIRIAKVLWYPASGLRTEASQDLQDNAYGYFRLSMLPTEDFSKGDIAYFTGVPTQEVDYRFQNLKDLRDYLEEIYATQETVREVYVYLDPVEIGAQYGNIAAFYGKAYVEQLVAVMTAHPETFFGFVIPNYSADYWNALGEKDRLTAEESIVDFLNQTALCENARVYFQGFEEWLIGNGANYVDERLCNKEVHAFLIALMLWQEEYVLTGENAKERLALAQELSARVGERQKLELTDYDLVFLGDSVIGNYTDSMSIPGVVSGVTGARVYNCGNGGSTASKDENSTLYFGNMVDYFLAGDVEALEECTFKFGVKSYREDTHAQRKQCFIINFGLNDFFRGFPVDNPSQPEDVDSYGGALRSGIRKLKEAYPEALVVLSGPNLITAYDDGTAVSGEQGGILSEYVEAARQIAEEYDALYVDTYYKGGYTLENASVYLADEFHPNQLGRYQLAWRMIEVLREELVSP